MEPDYVARQRALIERSLQAEREREACRESIRKYERELSGRRAYFKLQGKKRSSIVRECKGRRGPKKVSTAIEHGAGMQMRTKRFDNSYITVCYKCRPMV